MAPLPGAGGRATLGDQPPCARHHRLNKRRGRLLYQRSIDTLIGEPARASLLFVHLIRSAILRLLLRIDCYGGLPLWNCNLHPLLGSSCSSELFEQVLRDLFKQRFLLFPRKSLARLKRPLELVCSHSIIQCFTALDQ
jgi:hypothetical protein